MITINDISNDLLLECYRKQEKIFRIEDARAHTEAFREADPEFPKLGQGDYEALADLFLENQDANVAENDLWDGIINEYVFVKSL